MRFFHIIFFVCFCWITNCYALSSEIPQLNREDVLKASKSVTAELYPDADDVLLDDYTSVRYNPDGTAIEYCDSYQKILTEKGKRENNELTLSFTIPYDAVKVLLLEVIKPDGHVVQVDVAKQGKEMIDPQQMGSNIYNPNDKLLRVGIPDLQIGDIVHSITKNELKKTIFPNSWSNIILFEYTSPIKHHVYEVFAPKELPLKKIVLRNEIPNTVKYTKKEISSGIRHRWEVNNVSQLFPEPDMPSISAIAQRLLLSTIPDWESVSKWYWNISEPHLKALNNEMQQKVDEIKSAHRDKSEQIKALFRFVSQEIRYLGITVEKDAPGFEPHDVKMTFDNRHGVCRDKAALLVAMLRMAGFKAYPVLIYVGTKRDSEVPMTRFNHAIVAVEFENETILMDPTNENTKELFPAYLGNCSYIIAKENGSKLEVSPVTPAKLNTVNINTLADLTETGNINAKSEVEFLGINDSLYRGFFAQARKEERTQFFESMIKGLGGKLISYKLKPENILNTEETLKAEMTYSVDGSLVKQNEYTVFNPPYLGAKIGLVNFSLNKTGLEKRKYPLVLDAACSVNENLKITNVAKVGKIIFPKMSDINDEVMTWSWRNNSEQFEFKNQFALNSVEISPKQYLTLKKQLKQIEFDRQKKPIFIDDLTNVGDVTLLDRKVKIILKDEHTWSEEHYYKKKILSYKGKKEAAEVKLTFNTSQADVKVLMAKVTNGDKVKDVSPNEINLMDSAWVASAPRYPASKKLVLSLPSVEIGSVIEYKILIERKNMPFFATTQIFRDFNALKHKSVMLDIPKDLKLDSILDNNGSAVPDLISNDWGVKTKKIKQGDRVIYSWQVEEQAPLKYEDNLPPISAITASLHLSTGNWKSYANDVFSVLVKATENQLSTEKLVESILQDIYELDKQIEAIRDYVAKNIRLKGPDFNAISLQSVTPADTSLADGYGNTTDRAIVLYTMLKSIGLKPEFILIDSARAAKSLLIERKNHPDFTTFDSVLVQVKGEHGKFILNDTNQYARLGITASEGLLALNQHGHVSIMSLQQLYQNSVRTEYVYKVKEDGSATLTLTRKYYGLRYMAEKQNFSEMTPEEKKRYFQTQVAGISQSAKAISELMLDFDAYPGIESFAVDIKNFAVIEENFLYFNFPNVIKGISGIKSNSRENPFAFDAYNRLFIDSYIEMPEAFSKFEIIPQTKKLQLPNNAGKIDINVKVKDNTLHVLQVLSLQPAVLQAVDYYQLLAIDKLLAHPETRTVLVKK